MRLLITTQKVDLEDDVLGFFHDWIIEFSKLYEDVIVISLEIGRHDLPSNVEVVSLGKTETTTSRQIAFRFLREIWIRRKEYDSVFVHMNPEYIVVGGLFWRVLGKRIALWYTHRNVDTKLSIAEKFAHIIFTASAYSFRLPTKKLKIIGHGISVNRFHCKNTKSPNVLRIVSVGRITKIKNCDVLIRTGSILKKQFGNTLKIIFIGGLAMKEDESYFQELQKLVSELDMGDIVEFRGKIPNTQMPRIYCDASMSVNMTPTGGIDKAVLESMAARTPVLTSNEAFRAYLGEYADDLIFVEGDENNLAEKIAKLFSRKNINPIGQFLEDQAKKHFSVERVTKEIKMSL